MARADISSALAAGLTFRPVEETVADTLAWDRTVAGDRPTLAPERSGRSLRPDKRIRVIREPQRGRYDRETIDAILDEALLCHLGFEVDGQPYVIPTLHARVGDIVYVHGSAASRMLRQLAGGVRVCLTVTLFDGLVLATLGLQPLGQLPLGRPARRPRRSSATTRSATALHALTEQLAPGRWDEARQPTAKELKATCDPHAADRRGVGEGADRRPGGRAGRRGSAGAGPASFPCTSPPSASEYDWKRVHDGRVGAP